MKSHALSVCLCVAAITVSGVGCSSGGAEPAGAADLGPGVCQDALDYVASCNGSQPVVFTGSCDGQVAASASELLSLGCGALNAQKADADCAEFLARIGMCGEGNATLGPWGLRITKIVATDSRCRHATSDLVEPGLELRNAPTDEKCLETKVFRPTIDLGAEETYVAAGVPSPTEERTAILSGYGLQNTTGTLLLGNVGHIDGTYTVAAIPDAAFNNARALYLIETFEVQGIRGSHGMVRIRFDAPIVKLFNQYPASTKSVGTSQEIVLSVHATAVRGGSYDPLGTGLHDGMALARGIYTIEHKVQDVVLARKHTVQQYKLKMSGEDIRRYVGTYASDSPDRIFKTSYHTFNRNCGTEILQVFKDAFPERNYSAPETFDNTPLLKVIGDALNGTLLPDIIPEKVRPALESRGVFDGIEEPWESDPSIQQIVNELEGGS